MPVAKKYALMNSSRVRGQWERLRPHSRHQALAVVQVVLVRLDTEERQAEARAHQEIADGAPPVTFSPRQHRKRHREAAGEQHRGIDPADRLVEMLARFPHRVRVEPAVDGDAEEQAAEQHDLGREECPHAEECRLPLLLGSRELLGGGGVLRCGRRHQVPSFSGYW